MPISTKHYRDLVIPGLILLGLGLTLLLARSDLQKTVETEHAVTSDKLFYLTASLERVFYSRLTVVQALDAFVHANNDLDLSDPDNEKLFRRRFELFVDSLDNQISGILSMQLAPDARVTYVSKPEKNHKAIGHDLLVDDNRREQVISSILSRSQITAGPLTLIQGGEAIISRKAIFTGPGAFSAARYIRQNRATEDTEWLDRIPGDFWGLATVLIDTHELFQQAGLYDIDQNYQLAIRGRHGLGLEGEIFWGDTSVFDQPDASQTINLPGGTWVIAIKRLDSAGYLRFVIILVAGSLFIGLIVFAYIAHVQRLSANMQNKAKSQFLSHMSHELRTPLNAILGFSQLMALDKENLKEDQQENIGEILKAGNHLLNLIRDLLDLARIESGKLEITLSAVHVAPLLSETVSLMKTLADARQIKIISESYDEQILLYADESRLKQVLFNLLSNAIKYNIEQGSIRIRLQSLETGFVRISIIDTGIGIPKDRLSALFTPFDRLGAQSSTEGTGIGLVISRYLVEMMGGRMIVESQPGKGSQFSIEIPLYDTSQASTRTLQK